MDGMMIKNNFQAITITEANQIQLSDNTEGTVYYEACENSFEVEQIKKNDYNWGQNAILFHKKETEPRHNILSPSNYNNKENLRQNKLQCFSPLNPTTITNTSLKISNASHSAHSPSNNDCDNDEGEESSASFESSYMQGNEDRDLSQFINRNKFKSNPLPFASCLKITGITFELKDLKIDLRFLKKHLRTIPVRSKRVSNPNKHFRTLIELQNFYIDTSSLWVIKFSHNGKYLATGSQRGILKIFDVINYEYDNFQYEYNEKNILSYMNFLNEKPKQTLTDHNGDIIDLAWSYHNYNQLLTGSIDHLVFLWEVGCPSPLRKYTHGGMVTSVNFSPYHPNIFISGCLDKYVRIWKINEETKPDYFNIKEKITATVFFPNGESVAVGTHNGKIIIYDLQPKLSYNCSFYCRNRMGKNRLGKKVTNFEFINKSSALITTADSRLRYVSMPDGKLIAKYKGHLNEQTMIRATSDDMNDLIICGSENGFCYLWNRINKEKKAKKKKNYSFEFFKPFSKDIVKCSVIANEQCSAGFFKKVFKLTTNLFIWSIIVNATEQGRLQVLLNVEAIH